MLPSQLTSPGNASAAMSANDSLLSALCQLNASSLAAANCTWLADGSEMPTTPQYIITCSTVFYVLIFLLGTVGNVLVVFVVAANKDMINSTNIFLVNLSVADLLVIVVCMPSALVDIYAKEIWYLGEIM
ncbi:PREDICTED: allatostatin-A receptor-like isoform X2 [Priapulus caudatus]|uniref:Allatostatin-A receptor-like isoform X1 n=1 Tax=Priapulus caudatus TaxID=37621 RepID=A0ABM1EX62_PRICU|nr:PREDICTED: allatostatin-A receptor-like isoform X1 [Priapulus caudatus]XP_014676784.1 PREDICTED: allatostatin-A receptor-like isoform X2 [Priapulus caudatus]